MIRNKTEGINRNKPKIVTSDSKEKAQKVQCGNRNKYSLCNEKSHIRIFRRILDKPVMDLLDF